MDTLPNLGRISPPPPYTDEWHHVPPFDDDLPWNGPLNSLYGFSTPHAPFENSSDQSRASYHLPHHGLPQELRDIIYRYALCPPDGIAIRNYECGLKSVRSIASGLLGASRQVRAVTHSILHGENVFRFESLDSFQICTFLGAYLSSVVPLNTKHIHIERPLTCDCSTHHEATCISNNTAFADGDALLSAWFLEDTITLDTVTLDTWERSDSRRFVFPKWPFKNPFYSTIFQAFERGHVNELRFSAPCVCKDFQVFGAAVRRGVIPWLRHHNQLFENLEHNKDGWDIDLKPYPDFVVEKTGKALTNNDLVVLQEARLTLRRGEPRAGEDGLVAVLRRHVLNGMTGYLIFREPSPDHRVFRR